MLKQLLYIKLRRERRLRTTLARLDKELTSLRLRQQQLICRQLELRRQRYQLTQQAGCMNQATLNRLRTSLCTLGSEVERLTHEQNALIDELERLKQLRAEQEILLRLNLREQEKLQLLEKIL
ncbi:type III secretion protein [Salmonella enterica]|nr:type III secretion protein [Salmonella enterica subsp. enterica serovar Sandiego]EEC0251696.1 type III secretion protein [Salmonella enterica subsp. enterica]EJW2129037.1 type III secretion protein [Salmonella enterica]EEE4266813.1 type III secretion protein [Salmonella enterica subsp. enterica serovar Sandiego]EKT1704969.1 type III secretion protein [Salmonella enterica]